MTIPKYADCVSSGLPMIGDVPRHWRKTALKYLGDYQNGYPFKPEDWGSEGLPIIRISQLSGTAEPNYFAGVLEDRVRVENGDLLFSWSATIDSFLWEGGTAWLNQHIFKVTPSDEAEKTFLYYVIKHIAPKLAEFDAHGSTMRHIKKESLGERLYVPERAEQRQIASFLSKETARIDALVTEQQRLIELLKEKRHAVISHAITKGLNPSVAMRDSAVEWLGAMPAHWQLQRGRFLFVKADDPPEHGDGVVTAFRDGQVTLRENRRTDGFTMAVLELGYQHVSKGDLVIHGMDAFAGAIGVSESDGKCSPEYAVLKPKVSGLCNRYYAAVLRLMALRNFIYVICPSVRERAPRFRYETFKDVWLPVPPPDEQLAIVHHIEVETARIDELVHQCEELIELGSERRSALISAAVTGKIDVRNLASSESTLHACRPQGSRQGRAS